MKNNILILLFCFAASVCVVGEETKEAKEAKADRISLRQPFDASKAGHYEVSSPWFIFWSKQTCGYCKEPADECRWLQAQKEDIRKRWTRTQKGKTER
jgi:hypothetical protein